MTGRDPAIATPTLSQVISDAIEARLIDVHTMLPGKFVKYDAATQKADVQPLIKRKFSNGTVVELPVITDVTVLTYRTTEVFISLPIKAGDLCMLVFAERSIDRWLSEGGSVDPQDSRKFDLSDAVAYPGLYPHTMPVEADADNIVMKNGDSMLSILPDGKYKIENNSNELIDLLSQVVDLLSTTTTNTLFGPMMLNDFAEFASLKTKIDTLKG